MDKSSIIHELALLKEEVKKISEHIFQIEKIITDSQLSPNDTLFNNISKNEDLIKSFKDYLVNVKQLKEGSIKDYCGELRKIRIKFNEFMSISIPCEIYEIDDLAVIRKISQMFKEDKNFIELNKQAHNSLSAALNNYISFLEYNSTSFVIDED